MRLVDSEQRDVDIGQALDETTRDQPFRADVEQVQRVLVQTRQYLAGGRRAQAGIVIGRSDAVRDERVDLVLHQRDQRRHDDSDAAPMQRRDLVAQRLSAAGGHQHERIAPGDQVRDDRLLMRTKARIAEHPVQRLQRFGSDIGIDWHATVL